MIAAGRRFTHEIAASEQALASNVSGEVADYARMTIEQHTGNRTRTTALDASTDAAPAQAEREEVRQHLATTREHVATHLEKAQALQQGKAGQPSGQ